MNRRRGSQIRKRPEAVAIRKLTAALALATAVLWYVYASAVGQFAESTLVAAVSPRTSTASISAEVDAQASRILQEQPVCFVPNRGQWSSSDLYIARFRTMTVYLQENGWTLDLRGPQTTSPDSLRPEPRATVKMTIVDGSSEAIEPQWRLPGVHNYFQGEAESWRNNVPLYGAVSYRQVLPGVNLNLRESAGKLEFALEIQPSTDADQIVIEVQGIEYLGIDKDSSLVLETKVGALRLPPPQGWEEGPSGERSPIACHFVQHGKRRFSIEAATRRQGWTLVAEPTISWPLELTRGQDQPFCLVTDSQGQTFITGESKPPHLGLSIALPMGTGSTNRSTHDRIGSDAFVMRLSAESNLVFKTFLGGAGTDRSFTLAVDAGGSPTIAGGTDSRKFPTTQGAFDTEYNGGGDAFVTRITPSGNKLVYSTFLGGSDHDHAQALTLSPLGTATVTGATKSKNFPVRAQGLVSARHSDHEFVFLLDMLPTGVRTYGSTSPGCTGPLSISVTSMPVVGNQDFTLSCSGAPPNSGGGIITGTKALLPPIGPIVVLGAEMWVDPKGSILIGGSVRSNQRGVAHYALPIPANPALRGLQLFAQFAWMGPTAPAPCPKSGLSATPALEITVQ